MLVGGLPAATAGPGWLPPTGIVQAPIGSATTPELIAAVADAGGLGFLAASWLAPDELRTRIRRIRALTVRPFGVNLVLAWPAHERLAVALEEATPVISFFWGDPAPYLPAVRAAGARCISTIGSADEARRHAALGLDALVAQGEEAGGHVRGSTPLERLLPEVLAVTSGTPVLAAGGVAARRHVDRLRSAGAAGVWVGTRSLASREAGIHEVYRERVLAARAEDTVRVTLFDGGWPDAPHRVIRNSTVRRWEETGRPAPPHRPGEGEAVATAPDGRILRRYGDDIPLPGTTGEVEALALYAGRGVGEIHDILPAADIVRRLAG